MKTGYVLSGGGARGFAHLGVLKFLDEAGIKPYAISGTSAGAIVGTLYAAGKTPEEIHQLMKKNKFFGWNKVVWRKPGIFSMKVLEKVLKNNIPADDFNALAIKLFITATDINKGEQVCFSTGPVIQAVLASSSVPVVFEPVIMNDMILADGGILNNFPVEPLEKICNIIIGSHVNNIIQPVAKPDDITTLTEMDKSFHLAIAHTVYPKKDKCHVFLDPVLDMYDMFDVKNADVLFQKGYEAAKEQEERLVEKLSS